MRNNRPVLNFLYIEDSIVDKNAFAAMKLTIEDDYPDNRIKAKSMSLMGSTCGVGLEKLIKVVRTADIIVFDYGGLCQAALMGAGNAAIDYWNRFFIKMIEDKPSKDWRCMSAIDTFEPDDREQLEELGVKFQW